MSKIKQFLLPVGLLMLLGAASSALACSIRIENDSPASLWVVTTALAEDLKDVVTNQDVKDASKAQPRKSATKIKAEQTKFAGTKKTKTYHIYVKAAPSKQYVRLYQVQLKKCIPKARAWWNDNALTMSAIKNNKLTDEQEKFLAIISFRERFGYLFTEAVKNIQQRIEQFWAR